MDKTLIRNRIIRTHSGALRLYSAIRFRMIHAALLDEIEQYLPDCGTVLDLGCGIGLFSLYMALCRPGARVIGLDISDQRIGIARRSAEKLGLSNISFHVQDLRGWRPDEPVAAAYALDIFHHVDANTGNQLLETVYRIIEPGGRFVLKDVDTRPLLMLLCCHITDLVMAPRSRVYYRSADTWKKQLSAAGFSPVYLHRMRDFLPYPHILLVSSKPNGHAPQHETTPADP